MERSPARQISITYGVHIQVLTSTIVQGARATLPIIVNELGAMPVKKPIR